jgi:hypothetical protein
LLLRLPQRQGEKPSRRLPVRRKLQVRPNVLLQEVLSADGTPRILPVVRRFLEPKGAIHAQLFEPEQE